MRSASVLTKKPISGFDLACGAAGDGRADDQIVLAAVAARAALEGGEQRHEQRRPCRPAQLAERRVSSRRQ